MNTITAAVRLRIGASLIGQLEPRALDVSPLRGSVLDDALDLIMAEAMLAACSVVTPS
jgi:hypothetical protein